MSKGVLGNDPFKRGAADRSAKAESSSADGKPASKPEKPTLPDPRGEPQKTRIEKKQKAPPPLKPPKTVKREAAEGFDLKTGRRPIKQAIREMIVEPPVEAEAGTSETTTPYGKAFVEPESAADDRDQRPPKADDGSRGGDRGANRDGARFDEPQAGPGANHDGTRAQMRPAGRGETRDGENARADEGGGGRSEGRGTADAARPEEPQLFDARRPSDASPIQKVATDVLSKAVVAAAGLAKAVRTGLGAAGPVELDAYGKDPNLGQSLGPITDFLYERYWRVEVTGADRLPTGPCILVANHSGALPYDGPVLHEALKRERPDLADSRWLIEDQIFYAPVLGTLLNRLGAVRANPENALRLLEEGRPLIVFPEGIHGLQKPFAERYQLKRFGRGGFVKIALQTGAPIVPVAIVGAEETTPLLAKLPTTLFGMPYLPVAPLGPLPLPAKWHIRFGAPLTADDLRAAGEEEAVRVQRGTELTREAIQGMLEAILRDRTSAFR